MEAIGKQTSSDVITSTGLRLNNLFLLLFATQRATSKGTIGIRMTNAQIHADNAVRAKISMPEQREAFKLKRFQNINPRTSTKRGNTAYMVEARSNANKTIL